MSDGEIDMPSFNLNLVRGASHYFSGRLSAGVYIKSKIATLIDSGIDRETAKGFDKALQKMGCTVGAIINTHHHPDHCGGNAYFQERYPKLKIFATKFERPFIDDPFMTPFCFYGGATPVKELRNKHLEAEPSLVTGVLSKYEDQQLIINSEAFKIVTLPGHSHGLIGVVTPDNVFYCGDAIFDDETCKKHGVILYTDINNALSTFTKISSLSADACVFYHGGLAKESLNTIAAKHTKIVLDTRNTIASIINDEKSGLTIDQITQKVMKKYHISDDMTKYTLTRVSISAYITHLCHESSITLAIQDGLQKATVTNFRLINTDELIPDNKVVESKNLAEPTKTSGNNNEIGESKYGEIKETPKLLSKSAQTVQEALSTKGLNFQVKELAESTRTADEAAKTLGCEVAQIVKSLVFRTKNTKKPILVLASGSNRVNEKKIGQALGEKIEKPDADFVRSATGYAIGGIPPVGHTQQLDTFIDEDLLKFKELWAAAGTPNAVFSLSSSDIADLTHGKVMSIS